MNKNKQQGPKTNSSVKKIRGNRLHHVTEEAFGPQAAFKYHHNMRWHLSMAWSITYIRLPVFIVGTNR